MAQNNTIGVTSMNRDDMTYEIVTDELTQITLDEVIALASQALTFELSEYTDEELEAFYTMKQLANVELNASLNTNDNKRMH
jgi:hypothetical protein